MGTPEFSIPSLEALKNSRHKILTIYSQPASKARRGQKVISSFVEKYARKFSIKIRTPKILDLKEYDFLFSLKPDFVIVVAYGKIIPKKFLEIPKYGFINVHASLLPKWRGAAPIQRSIMNLDKQTGISIMKIVEELDAGPIIQQDKIFINENISALTLSKVLSKLGAKSLLKAIEKIVNKDVEFKEQDHSKATYAKKILKVESKINWEENAKIILAKINGLNPNPGAWFEYRKVRYKIWKAEIANMSGEIGRILDKKLIIGCKDKSIKILEIQKEGKNKQTVGEFLLGNKINQGDFIS